ncbi:MAG: metallophosphoesterase family protein, partial [Armatimonadota bacterium]
MKSEVGRTGAFATVVALGTAFLILIAQADRPEPAAVNAADVDGISAALVPRPRFTFAVISDTHITPPPAPNRKRRAWGDLHNPNTRRAIRQINAFAPAFVVNCGDVINSFPGLETYPAECVEAKKMMGEFEPEVRIVFGNHDTGNKKSFPKARWADRVQEPFCPNVCEGNLRYFRERFGKDFYSWDYDGCHFVVLDSQLFESGLPDEERQWQFLTQDLERSKGARHLFAFFHQPPYWLAPNEPGEKYYEIIDNPARLRLLNLLDRYGARVVFSGHTHWPIAGRYKRVLLFTLPSTAFQRNFGFYESEVRYPAIDPMQVGYALVRVYDDRVAVERVLTHPPLPATRPLQARSAGPRARLLPKMAADVRDNLLAVNARLPELKRGIWAVEGINDGRIGGGGV